MTKENISISIGNRISLERKRLNMRQEDIDVAQKTQSAIELGKNSPSLVYLYQLAQLGFDVQFIVTGVRSENLESVTTNLKQNQDAKQIVIAMLENAIALLKEDSP